MQRRQLLTAGVGTASMAATSAASVLAAPTRLLADARPKIDLESAVPRRFAGWQVDPLILPIPPSPDQAEVMSRIYDQIVSRTYADERGRRVMLSIAYGSRQNQEMRAHRQEVCYRAQGFRIDGLVRERAAVAGREVTLARMVARQGPRVEPVTYWFTMGDHAVMSYLDREMVQLRYALAGKIPDGYLVRLSDLSRDRASASFDLHRDFAAALMASVSPLVRDRLLGTA
jgi:EpsI family protein